MPVLEATISANQTRLNDMGIRVGSILKSRGEVSGKKLAVLGVTFKANTDDVREAPSKVILPVIQSFGVELEVYDPMFLPKDGKSVYDVISGSDGVLILTEWDEFKHLDWSRVAQSLNRQLDRKPLLIDLRNLLEPGLMSEFEYHSIGRRSL